MASDGLTPGGLFPDREGAATPEASAVQERMMGLALSLSSRPLPSLPSWPPAWSGGRGAQVALPLSQAD